MRNGVLVIVVWSIKPESADSFITKLRHDFECATKQPGFRNIRLHHGESDPTRFILIEEWDTAQDFTSCMEQLGYTNTDKEASEFDEWMYTQPEVVVYRLPTVLARDVS